MVRTLLALVVTVLTVAGLGKFAERYLPVLGKAAVRATLAEGGGSNGGGKGGCHRA